MAEGHTFKAYQPGGPSSGLLPASMDDIPLDFDTLQPHGTFIGSAAVVVLSDKDSAAHAALNMLRFFESRMLRPVHPLPGRLREGGEADAGAEMGPGRFWKTCARVMADASICGLGQAAPNPIRLTMKHFPDEV